MYSPCATPVVFAQRALFVAVRILGSRALPGARDFRPDPVTEEIWDSFTSEWVSIFGRWNDIALYRRPQVGRSGCSVLLLRDGRGVGFLRILSDHVRAAREFDVMSGVHAANPLSFAVARPVGFGRSGGWSWIGTDSLPNYPLGAVRSTRVRNRVASEITSILDQVLPRPADVPSHWNGSHGDLSPWNLRTTIRGAVRVIDWEDAGYAPPGSDELYGALTAHETFRTPLPRSFDRETIAWVSNVISVRREEREAGNSLNNRLLSALATIASS